jgi:hypothetical protein
VWTANAYPISPTSPSTNNLVEPVGCAGGPSPEDRCPYGYRIVGEKVGPKALRAMRLKIPGRG